MTESWLKLYRKLTQWEWYTNSHMVHLYLHLLLTANVSDKPFQGETIRRGQLLTSRNLLAQQTGMSEATVRRCLQRLCQTGEICIKATSRGTVITICKYDVYQYRDPADRPTDDPLLKNNRNILTPRTHAYDDSFPLKGDESGPLPPHRYGISPPLGGVGGGPVGSVLPYIEAIAANQPMMEQTCMNLHITPEEYGSQLRVFADEMKAQGATHTDEQDCRKHFYNWLRIRTEIQKRINHGKQHSQHQEEAADAYARRRGYEPSYHHTTDYDSDF
jgi:hypothetical protein